MMHKWGRGSNLLFMQEKKVSSASIRSKVSLSLAKTPHLHKRTQILDSRIES